ncbi:class II aldolase/adducin family protein [Affinibrenneria salicis]|uniref:Class II aldolase/adducin family protein n=1 Tax=Affinibrenneria salicis TaxID=2590031 RepID=A0A5J5FRI1_9GAMM|nr:class II aldolase/adducin family protein [Affinibrenneria salicis]KAA8994990.1 class II aldolase/adducin family protein [Affinibrenneria salicis]
MSDSEQQLRIQLAACYRLIAHFGMDDLIYNHISVRLPGPEHHFLINPYGLFFEEITASSLIKIDLEGNALTPTEYQVNRAGFVIHSAIHAAREDAICVLHTHSDAATAISALEEGLLPVSQFAMHFWQRLGYHAYEGVALDTDERRRLVRDIGPHQVLVLRNHGILAAGRTIPEAFMLAYYFERAARIQLMAQGSGSRLSLPADDISAKAARQFNRCEGDILLRGEREWPAFIRLLDRLDPGYRR